MSAADFLSTIYLTQAFGIGLIAAILFHYQRLRAQRALLLWAAAFLAHALGWLMSAVAHQLALLGLGQSTPRQLASFLSLAFAYAHVTLLFMAGYALKSRRVPGPSVLALGLTAALVLAGFTVFGIAQEADQQSLRILLRVGLRDTVLGLSYLLVALLLGRLGLSSRFGRRLLITGLVFYGIALLINAAVLWVDHFAEVDTQIYVPLNAMLLVAALYLGLALIVWLMEIERLRAEAATVQVQQVRRFDALTGFAQQEHFRRILEQRLASAGSSQPIALFRIGLDDFKTVNLAYGSGTGDRILVALSQRLRQTEDEALLGRLEGDEFAVVLPVQDPAQASEKAARLLSILERPYPIDGQGIEAPASIGVAIHPHDATAGELLLLNAKLALKQAKREGGRRCRFFDRGLDREARSRLEQSLELGRALANAHFEPHFQPIVRAEDGRVVGWEALARWRHERLGILPARDFLPLLEDSRRIAELDLAILEQAVEQLARVLRDRDDPDAPWISVNLSALTLERRDLPEAVAAIVARRRLDPRLLAIELTESRALVDRESSARIMAAFRESGIRVLLDDFGAGHSSLAQLLRLPLDGIKLDRGFLQTAPGDARRRALVAGTVQIANELGLLTIAEGIETPEDWRFARECGVRLLQGFGVARPLARMDPGLPMQTPAARAASGQGL
jgi:diguanylate cyclase (GGDEF)-like protein